MNKISSYNIAMENQDNYEEESSKKKNIILKKT